LSIQCPTKKKDKKSVVLNIQKKDSKDKKYIKTKKFLAKIYPLPEDMYKGELVELLQEWGPIGKVFLKKERGSQLQSATVEFMKRSQGLKAVYQLHDTTFDYLKINVVELTTKNYH
jgi:hypothetical protein